MLSGGCGREQAQREQLQRERETLTRRFLRRYSFTTLDSTWVHCASPCYNQLQTSAANSLVAAAKSKNEYASLSSTVS